MLVVAQYASVGVVEHEIIRKLTIKE